MEPIPYQEISNLALEVLHQRVTTSLQVLALGTYASEESPGVEESIKDVVSMIEKILDSIRLYSFTRENCFALWESFCSNPVLLDLIMESTDIFFLRLNHVDLVQVGNGTSQEKGLDCIVELATLISNVITSGRPKKEKETAVLPTFMKLKKTEIVSPDEYVIANDEFFLRGMETDTWYNLFCCNPWLLFVVIVKTSNTNLTDFFGIDVK